MDYFGEYLTEWIISNSTAVLILVASLWRPKLARLLFVLLFAWACWINFKTAHHDPNDYLNYAALTPFEIYRDFINGWFSNHITTMVTLISVGQGMIALGMLLRNWWVKLAGIGAIFFLLAIAPLGIGSGFPFSITASLAIYFILKKNDLNYLWKVGSRKK